MKSDGSFKISLWLYWRAKRHDGVPRDCRAGRAVVVVAQARSRDALNTRILNSERMNGLDCLLGGTLCAFRSVYIHSQKPTMDGAEDGVSPTPYSAMSANCDKAPSFKRMNFL